jgi:hypothetical protein
MLYSMRNANASQIYCTDNRNMHFTFKNFFSRKSCLLRDNVGKCGRIGQVTDDITMRRMRFACRINKATDTNWEYLIYIAFSTATMFTPVSLSVTSYVLCLSCVVHTFKSNSHKPWKQLLKSKHAADNVMKILQFRLIVVSIDYIRNQIRAFTFYVSNSSRSSKVYDDFPQSQPYYNTTGTIHIT